MIDLIPIGTINRRATENNPNKVSDAVEQTNPTKATADQNEPPRIERRKTTNRRRGTGDRRLLKKSARKSKLADRRQMPDRRKRRREDTKRPLSSFSSSSRGRLGGIVDEEV